MVPVRLSGQPALSLRPGLTTSGPVRVPLNCEPSTASPLPQPRTPAHPRATRCSTKRWPGAWLGISRCPCPRNRCPLCSQIYGVTSALQKIGSRAGRRLDPETRPPRRLERGGVPTDHPSRRQNCRSPDTATGRPANRNRCSPGVPASGVELKAGGGTTQKASAGPPPQEPEPPSLADPAPQTHTTERYKPDDTLATAATPPDLDPEEATSPPPAAKRPWRRPYVVELRWALFDEERRKDPSEFVDAAEFIRQPKRQ